MKSKFFSIYFFIPWFYYFIPYAISFRLPTFKLLLNCPLAAIHFTTSLVLLIIYEKSYVHYILSNFMFLDCRG